MQKHKSEGLMPAAPGGKLAMPKKWFRLCCLLALATLMLTVLVGCSASNAGEETADIQGIWTLNANTGYEFKSDGKGNLEHGDHGHAFSYMVQEDTLTITMSDSKKESTYSFILDGDKLTLTGTGDTKGTIELTRRP